MRENFLNIVELIVRQMSDSSHGGGMRGKNLLEGLFAEGYDPAEIEDALNWFERLGSDAVVMDAAELWDGFKGVRVQCPAERETLSEEAFAYLARLRYLGVIDDEGREAVLDKVFELDIVNLGVEHMRALIGLVMFSRENMSPDDIFHLLGDRYSGGQMNN